MIGLQKVSLKIHMQMRSWGFGTDFTETWWYFLQMSTPDVHNVRAIKIKVKYICCFVLFVCYLWPLLSWVTTLNPDLSPSWRRLAMATAGPWYSWSVHLYDDSQYPAAAAPRLSLSTLGPRSCRGKKLSFITLTSKWPRWRLKSPASRLFTQTFIQAQIKENIKAPRHWPLCGEFTGTGEFPAQRASNAENGSIWWRHHVVGFVACSGWATCS